MKRVALSLALIAAASSPMAAEPFGKFFFTPAERAALDQARMQKQRPQTKAEAEAPAVPAAPQMLTYGGVVRRSDGRAVLWLNNRPVDEKEALSSYSVEGRVRPDGAVTVQIPGTRRSVELKAGQTVELGTGTVAEHQYRSAAPARAGRAADTADRDAPAAARKDEPLAPADKGAPAPVPGAREEPPRGPR